jgi:glycosyltransferase involved in cell wall biosynthesis
MRVQWVGTFEPEFSRNRRLRRLMHIGGVDVHVIRRDVWGTDRLAVARGGKGAALWRALWAYAGLIPELLRADRPDLYLVSYPGWFDLPVVWLVSRLRGVPILFDPFISLHDTYVVDRSLTRPTSLLARGLKALDRFAVRKADHLLADTGPHLDLFRSLGGGRTPGHVLPLGADDELFFPRDQPHEEGLVVFYGTFVPLQGAVTIVDAAARLEGVARFVMIGDGQDRGAVERRIAELEVENLELVGLVPPTEVVDWISRCQVALGIFGTSQKANRVVPHKVFECLAVGAPVITRRSDAVEATLTEGEIVTVPAGDSRALASAIADLFEDPVRRRAVAAAGQAAYRSRFHESSLAADLVRAISVTVEAAGGGETP